MMPTETIKLRRCRRCLELVSNDTMSSRTLYKHIDEALYDSLTYDINGYEDLLPDCLNSQWCYDCVGTLVMAKEMTYEAM